MMWHRNGTPNDIITGYLIEQFKSVFVNYYYQT